MSLVGYKKKLTVKVQHTQHQIGFLAGYRASDLIDLLKLVPADATVGKVVCHQDAETDQEVIIIEFSEEFRLD